MMAQLTHSIGFAPLIPLWALGLLAILAAIPCIGGLVTRTRGALARLGCALVVLLWLSGPERLRETTRDLPETALLVVDQSASMSIRDRAAIARSAARLLGAQLGGQQNTLHLRVITVQGSTNGEKRGGTRLFDALSEAAADIPPEQFAGAVMLTDGQTHDAPKDALPDRLTPHDARGNRVTLPLHVLLTGKGEETDRQLRVLAAPPYAIVGQPATIRVEVDDHGPNTQPGTDTTVVLKQDGAEPMGVPVRTGTPQDISLPINHPGAILVGLSVATLPGEVSTLNNQDVVSINGVRDRLRVLLVSGTPNQGERVWRRLLKADPSVDLVHFTILRPPDKDDGTPLSDLALIAFPVRELFQEKIDQFDLIILDGFENRSILPPVYLRNIARFVRNGGGLLLTAGPEFMGSGSLQDTPVGDVLPAHVPMDASGVVVQRFRPQLTAAGRRHPVTAELPGAPAETLAPTGGAAAPQAAAQAAGQSGGKDATSGEWGPWYRALQPDSTRGETLMSGPAGSPLLVLDHVDRGRVALLLSDQIWLWSRGEDGGGPQAELLRRISHWLMKEPDLEEERLEASFDAGRLTVTRRTESGDAPPPVTITAPDGTTQPLTLHAAGPGLAVGHIDAAAQGIWQADDGTHRAFAAPRTADPEEYADLRATAEKLAPSAARSGGATSWLGADAKAPQLPALRVVASGDPLSGKGWIGFLARRAHVVTGTSARFVFPGWLALVAALALLGLGWWREGRG